MFKSFLLSLIILSSPMFAFAQAKSDHALVEKAKNAVALLYSQDESGGMRMRCTATVFEKTKTIYKLVSAAHCIGDDNTTKERSADPTNTPFYISFDNSTPKEFYKAKAVFVGYQHKGDDFAVFEVESKEDWPVLLIGTEKSVTEGSALLNVASPQGLGKQVFRGSISSMDLDRPIIEGDINWQHALLLQIQSGPGSSGSALISIEDGTIIGFLVGVVGGNNVVGIPVSKFTTALSKFGEDKYPYFKKSVE